MSRTEVVAPSDMHVDEIRLGADIYFSLDTAITCAILRDLGHEGVARIEARLLRSHQRQYFLDGLRKLSLDKENSDAVRCAKYHCMSNALGGLRVRYAVESERKAWIIYDTPYYLDSPAHPSVTVAAFQPSFLLAGMEGWHANNGELLGNRGLAFICTHLAFRGDPYDAGYFSDTGRDLRVSERFQIGFGEAAPANGDLEGPDLDPHVWPEIRKAKAARNFANSYIAGRLYWLSREYGPDRAAAIFEHGLRVTLFQRAPQLRPAGLSAVETAAALFRRFQHIGGNETRLSGTEDDVRVDVTRSRWHEAAEFKNRGFEPELDAAIGKAWQAFMSYVFPEVQVTREPNLGPASESSWQFRN